MNPLQATTTGLEPASELAPRTTPGRPSAPAAVALPPATSSPRERLPAAAGHRALLPLASSLERDSCASTALGDIIDRSLNAAVDGLSPGPLKTRAASGIDHFDELIEKACARAPERRLVAIEDVGAMATDLVSDFARNVTGNVAYIDAGYHVMS